MNFTQAIQSCFQKYATFSGRASRSEYWYWTLFTLLLSIGFNVLEQGVFFALPVLEDGFHGLVNIIDCIVSLALLIPGIAVSVRRLHDINRSGWWFLLSFTIIGVIPLIVFACMRGTKEANRFGADPLVVQ